MHGRYKEDVDWQIIETVKLPGMKQGSKNNTAMGEEEPKGGE